MKKILVIIWLFSKYCTSDEGINSETVIKEGLGELKNESIPHLFIFKRSANASTPHKPKEKNAGFVLVDTATRGSDKKLKYSPVVDEKSISTTPSSVQGRRDERSAAHVTPGPYHQSSTISYQFTTTDGLGYVHVEIGNGATTSRPISNLFPSPLPDPKPILHHHSTPPPREQLKTPTYDHFRATPHTVTVKSMPAYPPAQKQKPTYSPLKPSYVQTEPEYSPLRQNQAYDPPKQTYKPAYTHPKPTYASPPKPAYNPPEPTYTPPSKPAYIPPEPTYAPPPKPVYAPPPKPAYNPPELTYTPSSKLAYIPPKPTYAPPPKPVYAPPPKLAYITPKPTYAPPPKPAYTPPKPTYAPLPKPAYSPPKPTYDPLNPKYTTPKPTYDSIPVTVKSMPAIHHHSTMRPSYQRLIPTVTVKSMPLITPTSYHASPQPSYVPPYVKAPEMAYHEPEPAYYKPKPTYHEPKPTYHEPKPTYHEPKPAYHEPKPAYQEVKPSYHETKPTYHEPKLTYHEPKLEYHEPKPEYHEPKPVYQEPKPTYHEIKPAYHDSKPAYHDPKSAYHGPKPAYDEPKPAYHDPKPAYHEPKIKELQSEPLYYPGKDPSIAVVALNHSNKKYNDSQKELGKVLEEFKNRSVLSLFQNGGKFELSGPYYVVTPASIQSVSIH